MLGASILFFLLGIAAAVIGLSGIAGLSAIIAVVLLIVSFLRLVTRDKGRLGRWLGVFVLIGLSIAGTFLIITSFFPGETFLVRLGTAYQVLWENTTQRQFTSVMRENPWLLIIPGGTILLLSGLLLPLSQWGRAVYVYLAFGIGFLAGHVFW